MKTFCFTIYLTGFGNNADEAWRDATEAANLAEDETPEDYTSEEMEDDE